MLLSVLFGLALVAGVALLALVALPTILGGLRVAVPGRRARFFLILLQRSLLRNPVRTALTACATSLLVTVVLAVWVVLQALDQSTEDRAGDRKFIVRARYTIPSEMPLAYAAWLERECQSLPDGVRPKDEDTMAWQLYMGTVDPARRAREDFVVCFALEPRKILTMMDAPGELPPEEERAFRGAVARMEANRQGMILGRRRLSVLNKQVGDRIKVTGINHLGIDLELEIVGVFPPGRWEPTAVINRDYLNAALDEFERRSGVRHPMTERTLSLFWVRVPDRAAAEMLAARVLDPGRFSTPPLIMETPSSGVAVFVEGYRDLIWAMRWLLVPAVLVTMALLGANTVRISVRERDAEVGVLKVLGYTPRHVAALVVGEAVLVGVTCGFACAGLLYVIINLLLGGLRFSEPMVDFTELFVPAAALWWGPAIGGGAALAGSLGPAWSACRLNVAAVLGRVQ
jgi:putative ABC transport system permease protein